MNLVSIKVGVRLSRINKSLFSYVRELIEKKGYTVEEVNRACCKRDDYMEAMLSGSMKRPDYKRMKSILLFLDVSEEDARKLLNEAGYYSEVKKDRKRDMVKKPISIPAKIETPPSVNSELNVFDFVQKYADFAYGGELVMIRLNGDHWRACYGVPTSIQEKVLHMPSGRTFREAMEVLLRNPTKF